MIESPLAIAVVFQLGPIPVTAPVLVTWGIMALLAGGSWLLTRRLALRPSGHQAVLELVVEGISNQIRDTMRGEPWRYLPLIGTLFLFILTANWSSLVPGIEPPTAHIETDAALALIVFIAIAWFGIRARGLGGWLASFAEPNLLMLPLNLVESITRTFSLLVRLFGNVMSAVFVIGIVLSLVGLLVPVPLMALELLTGAVQAYIFSVLATVFIAGAVGDAPQGAGANQ
jgi:F-type H+-transporting ATPase subunit a